MTDKSKEFYKELEERVTKAPYRLVLESPAESARLDIGGSCLLGAEERLYILTQALMTTFTEYVEGKTHGEAFLVEMLTWEAELYWYFANMED